MASSVEVLLPAKHSPFNHSKLIWLKGFCEITSEQSSLLSYEVMKRKTKYMYNKENINKRTHQEKFFT